MKGAMVMVLGQASAALFACVSMLTNHEHWELEEKESEKLGEALDAALSTLPEQAYEKVIAIADKWYPWAKLVFIVGILIWTRIEESAKLVEAANYKPGDGSVGGSNGTEQGRAQANYKHYHSSLGYNN
jgi:hypothetical protein